MAKGSDAGADQSAQTNPATPSAPTAPAEQATAGVGEIVVTANRRAENLERVPISVAAVTGAQLQTRGITNTTALSGSLPNVRVNSPYGNIQPNFTVRGVGVANQFNANTQSPVGVYFDDVYQGFRASHGASLYDLERIEVLKGPQGTLYGRNTTGGAINMITRRPGLDGDNGYITAGVGNYSSFKMDAAAETTLIDDKLGVRIAFDRNYHSGYIQNTTSQQGYRNNLVGNKNFESADDYSARISVRAKPTENLDITLRGYFQRSNPIGFGGIGDYIPPNYTDPLGYSRTGLNGRQASLNDQGYFPTRTNGTNAHVDWNLGKLKITSITGYDNAKITLYSDYDGGPNDIGNYYPEIARQKEFSQDLHASLSAGPLDLIFGAYYSWQQIDTLNKLRIFGFLNALAGPGVFNPGGGFFNPAIVPPTALNIQQGYQQVQRSYAGFIEAKLKLTNTLSLTLGGRMTHDNIVFRKASSLLLNSSDLPGAYAYATTDAATLPGVPVFVTTAPLRQATTKPTGRVILSDQVNPNTMFYASYSRGYRSGTYNGASLTTVPDFVPPEFVDAFEGGFKIRALDNHLQVNGAIFYNRYKGQQVTEVVGGVSFLRSLNGKSYGAEMDLVAQIGDRLRINAAAGYLHSSYNHQFLAPGDPHATDPRGIDIAGNPFPNAPRWTANFNPEYTLADIGSGKFILSGELEYSSQEYFDPFGDRQAVGSFKNGQPGYALVNGRLRYEEKRFSVAVWSQNLFNKYYYAYRNNLEGGFNESLETPGPPRTFGVEGTLKF